METFNSTEYWNASTLAFPVARECFAQDQTVGECLKGSRFQVWHLLGLIDANANFIPQRKNALKAVLSEFPLAICSSLLLKDLSFLFDLLRDNTRSYIQLLQEFVRFSQPSSGDDISEPVKSEMSPQNSIAVSEANTLVGTIDAYFEFSGNEQASCAERREERQLVNV